MNIPNFKCSNLKQNKIISADLVLSDDFKTALDLTSNLIWIHQLNSGYCNQGFKNYVGLKNNNINEFDFLNFIHREDAEHFYQIWQEAHKTGQKFDKECRIKSKDGKFFWFLIVGEYKNIDSKQQNWVFSCTYIHDRVIRFKEISEALKKNSDMLDVSVDCIKIINTNGNLIHMNKSGCLALLGKEKVKKFDQNWLTLLPPEVQLIGRKAIKKAVSGQIARFAGKSTHLNEAMYWDNILTPIKDENGDTINILCVSRDITKQKVAEAKLKKTSEYDELTGLMNRRAFKIKLKKAIVTAKKNQKRIGMMFIDLDHFKNINDTLGHPAGDHLLKVLSNRLSKSLEQNCFVTRLGGDEFAIIITNLQDEKELKTIAKKVLELNKLPVTFSGKIINSGMSIGCATYPKDAQDVFGLMKCADTALNDLKEKGRGGYRMYDEEMYALAKQKMLQLETARNIISENKIEAYYQPKVKLDDFTLVGFEALIRWHNSEQNLQYPQNIVDAFNDYELASQISEIMHKNVFTDMATWIKKGIPLVPIAINASPVEFMRDNYAELLITRLEHYQIPAELVEIEITEHILAERGADFVIRALNKLKEYGLKISLDDFGTGHSSMTHLRDYPVDCLKIDYAFVNKMIEEKSINSIVEGIAKLGPILSLDVIAEGVETEQQLNSLQKVGCRYGQGFLFSHAVSKQEAEDLMIKKICEINYQK